MVAQPPVLLHFLNAIINIFEQLAELFGRDCAERDADKARKHDCAGAVVLDEFLAQCFGVHALRLDAHEVTAVARHGLEGFLVFGVACEHVLDDVVALLEGRVLLSLLVHVFGALVGGEQNPLADGGTVADVAADRTGGLVFEGLELGFGGALETEGHEPDAEAPDVVFLGGAVELDGEQVLVGLEQLHEQGFLGHAFLVHESEVGIVEQGHDLVACGGAVGEDLRDFDGFLLGGGVAGRVVREVQEHDLLLALAFGEGGLEGFGIEPAVLEGVERLDLRAAAVHEHELVVVPVEVGDDDFVTLVEEEVARAADGVGEGAGHDRVAELLAGEARVLADNLFLPCLAEVGVAETRGVQERLLGEVQALEHAVEHERAPVVFEGGADGRVDFGALGFGALAQNALAREEDCLAPFGEHGENVAAVCGEFRVCLFGERIVVHDLGPVKNSARKDSFFRGSFQVFCRQKGEASPSLQLHRHGGLEPPSPCIFRYPLS